MSIFSFILVAVVFATLCAFVIYALQFSQTRNRSIADTEKLSIRWRQVGALIIGTLFFLPAFLLSLPFTVMWAKHEWPGEGQAVLGAFWPSVGIALISAVSCCVYLLRRVRAASGKKN